MIPTIGDSYTVNVAKQRLPNPTRMDPTRTATLRRKAEQAMAGRIRRLQAKVRYLLLVEDVFGMLRRNQLIVTTVENTELVGNVAWRFHTDAEKVKQFQQWFASQVEMDLLDRGVEDAYYQKFAEAGYKKGAGRAFSDVRKSALYDQEGLRDFYAGSKAEFLRSAFANPVAIDKIKQLTGRIFTELKSVDSAMAASMTRTLADGMARGSGIREITREMTKSIDTIGRVRAQRIARTEIVRAHAEGQLDAMEKLGVQKLGVMVEWSAAGDDRVCPACQELDGVVITLKEARGILPRHPNCLVGNMRICTPDLVNVMRVEYTGEIYDFVLADGRRVSTTSHHVLLTQRGWVFAKEITDSDYFVDTPYHLAGQTPNQYLREPFVEDVFGTFVEMAEEVRITKSVSAPEYLHGDGKFVDSEICIVSADGVLRDQHKTLLSSSSMEPQLSRGNVASFQALGLDSPRLLAAYLKRTACTTDSLMSSLGILDVLRARSILHHESVGSNNPSDINSFSQEYPLNSSPAEVEPLVETISAGSIQVEFDNLVRGKLVGIKSVSTRHVSSFPVFDVSTQSTLYSVEGLITSNCRCAYMPANVGEPSKGQIRGKAKVDKAIDDSIRSELPKRTKRTLAEQKNRSSWFGAKKPITTRRPRSILDPKTIPAKPRKKPRVGLPSTVKPIPPATPQKPFIPKPNLHISDPKPGESPSAYMDRMLGKVGSQERKLADATTYQYYLKLWDAAQRVARKEAAKKASIRTTAI